MKGLKLKNKGHTNFYECCDLTKKVYLTYILHREYFLILITFRIFKVFSSEVLIILQDTLGQNEKFCNLPLTWPLQKKKRLRKMQQGIILISQGGRIVFFDECSMCIYMLRIFFFLVEFVYFYELKNPWSKKGGRKKNSARKFLQQMFSEILYFWGYLFTFRAACLIKNPPFRLSIDL